MEIIWLADAFDDLDTIADYIAADNPEAADRMFMRIREAVRSLKTLPNRGRPGRVTGTRELVIASSPYIVPYRVRGDTIEILRVLHGARRWPDRFE